MSFAAPAMNRDLWNRQLATLCWVSLASIAVGFLFPPRREPAVKLQAQGDWQLENFATGAVYTAGDPGPEGVRLFGSRVGGDDSKGTLRSPWYRVHRSYGLFVAGYPSAAGNRLEVEVRVGDRFERIPVRMVAREHWDLWIAPSVGANGAEVRIVAVDGSSGPGGWLGVSEPVEVHPQPFHPLATLIRIIGSVALAAALALGPGICLRAIGKWPASPALLIVPGLCLLCGVGWCCWILARFLDPEIVAAALLVPSLAGAIVVTTRTKILLSRSETLTLRVYFTIVAIAVAKATWSPGPPGELYGGTISRTLERGDRSDSRIPYHVVQLALRGQPPNGGLGRRYFAPWTFSHRGPLAGVAAAPIVALSGASVPQGMPDAGWEPFDPEGFAAYRIALIALAASCVLPVLALSAGLAGEAAGRAAVASVAGAPFIVHEIYFTWPKLLMATLVLIALWAILERRPGFAGVALGAAYLVHPAALFSIPSVALAWPLRLAAPQHSLASVAATVRRRELWKGWLAFCVTAVAPIAAWRIVNGKAFQQSGFLVYLTLAGDHVAHGAADWMLARLLSVSDTLVPLFAFFHHLQGRSISAAARAFFFQYWCTVPAGFGFVAFPFFAREIYRFARAFKTAFMILIVIPFVAFVAFWGAPDSGLLREGLHAWVLIALALAGCMWAIGDRRPRWAGPSLAARALEILGMTVGACLFEGSLVDPRFRWTDSVSLLVLAGATALLACQVMQLLHEADPAFSASPARSDAR